MKDGSHELTRLGDVTLGHANALKRVLKLLEPQAVFIAPFRPWDVIAIAGTEVAVRSLVIKLQMLPFLQGGARDEIIEYMKIALAGLRAGDPIALEVVVKGLDAAETAALGELELGVFAEAGGVGVKEGAGVAECLDDELGAGNLAGELSALLSRIADAEF